MSSWPPKEGVTTPKVTRKNAVISASASTRINAPAAVVFETLINIAQYPEWNTSFCPTASIVSQPSSVVDEKAHLHKGTVVKFTMVMEDSKTMDVQCVITDISTPEQHSDYIPTDELSKDATFTSDLNKVYRIAWFGEGASMKSERFHEVVVIGENECEVRMWACWSGMLARGMKLTGFGKKAEARSQQYVGEIKQRAEQHV